jgi:predicted flap endonuclease-1-like 5' DNA nuclease
VSFVIVETLTALVAALVLGIIIGWALHAISQEGELKEKERRWRERSSAERPARPAPALAPLAAPPLASASAAPAGGFSATAVLALQSDLAASRDASAKKDADLLRMRSLLQEIEAGEPVPITPGVTLRDDLTEIRGIGPVLERSLNKYGIFNFRQLALWTPQDAEHFASHAHEHRNRVVHEQWVAQARRLHHERYGETV